MSGETDNKGKKVKYIACKRSAKNENIRQEKGFEMSVGWKL